jgi:hypothetical protein
MRLGVVDFSSSLIMGHHNTHHSFCIMIGPFNIGVYLLPELLVWRRAQNPKTEKHKGFY